VIAIQLDLFEDVVILPWYGKSPRSLTRSRKALFLERERKRTIAAFNVDQYDMFRRLPKKAPRVYLGAPLLLPLDEEGR